MLKYWLIIRNTWDEYATYRLNFILWRVRVVIRFLIVYFLWSSIYSVSQNIFGYNRVTMLTYVVLVYLVSNFVFATRTQDIGSEINEGKLSNYLLKPINYFAEIVARDISDKLLNLAFTIIEMLILFSLLHPPFFVQNNLVILLLSVLAFIGSIVIYFCISMLLGFIGFWTTEVWAVRFIFIILLDYLSGNFFPIDILPKILVNILFWTPFPYLFYFPVKIYLGTLSISQFLPGFLVEIIWIMILIYFLKHVWKRGLKVYGAEGR